MLLSEHRQKYQLLMLKIRIHEIIQCDTLAGMFFHLTNYFFGFRLSSFS